MRCPYRSRCPYQCPGDSYDPFYHEWEPVEGFVELREGILCMDWDVVVPKEVMVIEN